MPFENQRGYLHATRSLRGFALAIALGLTIGTTMAVAQQPQTALDHESNIEVPRPAAFLVTLIADGETRSVLTSAKTVGDLLAAEKAYPSGEDRCSVPLSAPIKDGMRVAITRVKTERFIDRIAIPFTTRQRYTSSLRAGVREVVTPGKPGQRVKVVLNVFRDGKLVQVRKIAESVTKPRQQVVLTGTRGLVASRGYFGGRRTMTMVATGYGPTAADNGRWAGQTATGLKPGYGVVAVDPRFIPLGTRLYIEGYGYAVAGDTGSAIKGNRIDLGHDTYSEAARVGRKKVKVIILN